MLALLEILPVILFGIVYFLNGKEVAIANLHYQFDGIYSATAALMLSTVIVFVTIWFWKRTLTKGQMGMLAMVLILGGATIILHNPNFLKWKPTVLSWALAIAFAGTQQFSQQGLVERALGEQITLPAKIYARLSFLWAGYFLLLGTLNLIVAFQFPEAFWVKYKLWSMASSPILAIISAIMIAPNIKETPDTKNAQQNEEKSP
ncbi:MAG TPA: inner membrane-spanning protein YciB [Pseudomonadales bacterium]|jgi:intracellular septation protein|nr:inner membrane-spanning protein YciB [Pseudomonadales bacterium]HNL92339.1 inner membrane-spanning protein YciB [Pseudomonadales bacterium]